MTRRNAAPIGHGHVVDISEMSGIRAGLVFRTGWTMMLACPFGSSSGIDNAQLVDLRSAPEVARARADDAAARIQVPIDLPGAVAIIGHRPGTAEYAALYAGMIRDCGGQIAEVFSVMAQAQPRPVVIGCSLGKDRTGLVVGILMRFLGITAALVSECDGGARSAIQRCEPGMVGYAEQIGISVAELRRRCTVGSAALDQALQIIDQEYEGAGNYLRAHGATNDALESLRRWLESPLPTG